MNNPFSTLLRSASGRASLFASAALFLAAARPAAATNAMTHAALQAVNADGTSPQTWTNQYPFVLRGIWLNAPAEMLPSNYVEGATSPSGGGQFQVFVQAVDAGDRGGTALYMAQRGYMASMVYSAEEWTNEYRRVTTDAATGRTFQPGDYVEVTARMAMHYNGKVNVNEGHRTDAAYNFDIRLLTPNAGLPQAEALTLSDLVDSNNAAIFDATRATGGEHWQGMRVRLDAIRLTETNPAGWNPAAAWGGRLVEVADATGRTFHLRMPRTDLGAPPPTNAVFSVVGILNQEGSNTNGYELFVQEIGPILALRFDSDDGAACLSYSADYEGFELQYSDDGGDTWSSPPLAFPVEITVRDATAPLATQRFYRLRQP